MNMSKSLIFLSCLMILAFSVSSELLAQPKKRIAVMEFKYSTAYNTNVAGSYGHTINLGEQIADALERRLSQLGTYEVIARRDFDQILAEQKLSQSGILDPETGALRGKVKGIDSMIPGTINAFRTEDKLKKSERRKTYKPCRFCPEIPLPNTDDIWVGSFSAEIELSYKLINATTGALVGDEVTGAATRQAEPSIMNQSSGREKLTQQVVSEAVNDAVNKIVLKLQEMTTVSRDEGRVRDEPVKEINGEVLEIDGSKLVIIDIDRSAVKPGDRLIISRSKSRKTRAGKIVKYSDEIGEVEVIDAQAEVIIGKYLGTTPVVAGDRVTRNRQ